MKNYVDFREPLDYYEYCPEELIAYKHYNGLHFNKKLHDWAVARMKKLNTSTDKLEPITPWSKEDVVELLTKHDIKLVYDMGYDAVYVANMAKADFFKSSLPTEKEIAQFVKDMVDDPDQADGFIFCRFISDCDRKGLPIPWQEVI